MLSGVALSILFRLVVTCLDWTIIKTRSGSGDMYNLMWFSIVHLLGPVGVCGDWLVLARKRAFEYCVLHYNIRFNTQYFLSFTMMCEFGKTIVMYATLWQFYFFVLAANIKYKVKPLIWSMHTITHWKHLFMECSHAAIFNGDVCNIVVTLVLNFRKTLASIPSVNIFFNILSILSS